MGKDRYWVIADIVKRRLFDRLRKEMWKIDYLDYRKYRKGIEDIYSSILEEWENIKEEYKGDPDADFTKLRGFLYEALFYYACLKTQTLFIDAEILEMGGKFFELRLGTKLLPCMILFQTYIISGENVNGRGKFLRQRRISWLHMWMIVVPRHQLLLM